MRIYKVKVNGKTFEVKILSVSETEPLEVETVKATPVAKTAAPADTLLILEAMKLENEIKAPSNGKVLEIRVQKGATVNSKDVLVVLG